MELRSDWCKTSLTGVPQTVRSKNIGHNYWRLFGKRLQMNTRAASLPAPSPLFLSLFYVVGSLRIKQPELLVFQGHLFSEQKTRAWHHVIRRVPSHVCFSNQSFETSHTRVVGHAAVFKHNNSRTNLRTMKLAVWTWPEGWINEFNLLLKQSCELTGQREEESEHTHSHSGQCRLTVWVTSPGAIGNCRLSRGRGLDSLEGEGLRVHTHWRSAGTRNQTGNKKTTKRETKREKRWKTGEQRSHRLKKDRKEKRGSASSYLRGRGGGEGGGADLLWILNSCKMSILIIRGSGHTQAHSSWHCLLMWYWNGAQMLFNRLLQTWQYL